MNNYYKLYIEDIYTLAQSIVIKFHDAATAINLKVMSEYGPKSVTEDVKTWKYYQNISGDYHFSDVFENNSTRIKVTSLDTLEVIEFTKAMLALHPTTKAAYSFGNRHYHQLIQKYPEQELLIMGILYPCDIDHVIAVRDGTILSYPIHLVDGNEYTFIEKLQTWIFKYIDRWINKQFTICDDLYTATYMGQLYIHLIPAIINIRLQACKTNEAHSYHLREYLASNGMLDIYLDVMTINQALFFYRNILYIQRNSGKRDTFDWLVENLMTNRSLPFYEYTMKHYVSGMITSGTNELLSYSPDIVFKRNPINFKDLDKSNTYKSLHSINLALRDTVPGNKVYLENNTIPIRQKLEDSKSSVVSTKLLESTVSDYQLATPYILEDILLNHWLYWSCSGNYSAYVQVMFTKTKRIYELSTKDAAILFIYAMNKSIGVDLVNIPDILATRVLPLTRTPKSKLLSITNQVHLNPGDIDYIYSTVPVTPVINSTDAFFQECKLIYLSTIKQYLFEASAEDLTQRGYTQAIVTGLYADIKTSLGAELYSEWATRLGLDFTQYTDLDFLELASAVTVETTGLTNNKDYLSIRKLQLAMVDILKLLSSYSIEVISNNTEPPIIVIPRPSVRVGDQRNLDNSLDYVDSAPVFILYIRNTDKDTVFIDLNLVFPFGSTTALESDKNKLDIGITISISKNISKLDDVRVHIPNIHILDTTARALSRAFVEMVIGVVSITGNILGIELDKLTVDMLDIGVIHHSGFETDSNNLQRDNLYSHMNEVYLLYVSTLTKDTLQFNNYVDIFNIQDVINPRSFENDSVLDLPLLITNTEIITTRITISLPYRIECTEIISSSIIHNVRIRLYVPGVITGNIVLIDEFHLSPAIVATGNIVLIDEFHLSPTTIVTSNIVLIDEFHLSPAIVATGNIELSNEFKLKVPNILTSTVALNDEFHLSPAIVATGNISLINEFKLITPNTITGNIAPSNISSLPSPKLIFTNTTSNAPLSLSAANTLTGNVTTDSWFNLSSPKILSRSLAVNVPIGLS